MQESRVMGCRNGSDPFTLESLEGLEERRIINIQNDCFDLKPLFNWVYNEEKFTNPLTNIEFSDRDLSTIRGLALRDFPCEVEISVPWSGRFENLKTSTLSNYQRVFINVMKKLYPRADITTFYRAIYYSIEEAKVALRGGYKGDVYPIHKLLKEEILNSEDTPMLPRAIRVDALPINEVPFYLEGIKEVLRAKGLPVDFISSNLRSQSQLPVIAGNVKFEVSIICNIYSNRPDSLFGDHTNENTIIKISYPYASTFSNFPGVTVKIVLDKLRENFKLLYEDRLRLGEANMANLKISLTGFFNISETAPITSLFRLRMPSENGGLVYSLEAVIDYKGNNFNGAGMSPIRPNFNRSNNLNSPPASPTGDSNFIFFDGSPDISPIFRRNIPPRNTSGVARTLFNPPQTDNSFDFSFS